MPSFREAASVYCLQLWGSGSKGIALNIADAFMVSGAEFGARLGAQPALKAAQFTDPIISETIAQVDGAVALVFSEVSTLTGVGALSGYA